MTIGKNKKKPKKNVKTKKVDVFARKQWYKVQVPSIFPGETCGAPKGCIGRTFVNKSSGNTLSENLLLGRVFSVNLADLNSKSDDRHKVIKLIVEHVADGKVYTNFYGLVLTTDFAKSLVRKFQTLIEAHTDIKTTDGAVVRIFALTFTKRALHQVKKTCYAQTSQVRLIRQRIIDIINRDTEGVDLKKLFENLTNDLIAKNIEKEASGIYPLQNTAIKKVKILKRPKVDLKRLMELHSIQVDALPPVISTDDIGTPVVQVQAE